MKKKKVVATGNLPTRHPFVLGLLAWLALDHWHAPQWAYGAVGLLWLLLLITWIIAWSNEIETDIFDK